MKNALIIVLTLGLVAALAMMFFKITGNAQKFRTVTIGATAVKAELADTAAKREKGLSGRAKLPEDEGMLFVFDKPDEYFFWMKGMRFPLDLIYLNTGEVVEVKENISPSDQTPFAPAEPVDAVLEVNAGYVARRQIRVGDPASY